MSRVESSRVEPGIYSSSQELNYGLLVAPILYSQMCARALALADTLSAVRFGCLQRLYRSIMLLAAEFGGAGVGGYSLNYYHTCLQRHEIAEIFCHLRKNIEVKSMKVKKVRH